MGDLNTAAVSPSPRIGWLDSVRGLSSVLVMFLHYFHVTLVALIPFWFGQHVVLEDQPVLKKTLEYFAHSPFGEMVEQVSRYIFGYWDLAKIGVIGLFIISGYMVPYGIANLKTHPIRTFVLGRFFRLYPIYWISLLLAMAYEFYCNHVTFSLWQIATNFTMFHKYLFVEDINGVAWTLQIELGFYALCILLFMGRMIKNPVVIYCTVLGFMAFALLLGIARGITGQELPVAFPLRLCIMFLGFYYRMWKEGDIAGLEVKGFLWQMVPLFVMLAITCFSAYQPYGWTYFNSYWMGMSMVLLFGLANVNIPLLNGCGRLSYTVYLFHAPIGKALIPLVVALSPMLYQQSIAWLLLPMVAAMGVTYGVSYLAWRYIEGPCWQWGKAAIKRLNTQ